MKRYRIETNSRQITPKHDGKPAIIRDQRTRPVNKIDNLTKSAKPPSPVQIRAAPPFFRRMSSVPAGARLAGHSLCSEEPSIRSSVPSRGLRKSLRCDELSASDLCRGGGFETSASASRPRRMRSIGRSAAGATAPTHVLDQPLTEDTTGIVVPDRGSNTRGEAPSRIRWSDDSGRLRAGPSVGTGSDGTRPFAVGDVDGDGCIDIALANECRYNHVLFNKPQDVSEAIISVTTVAEYARLVPRVASVECQCGCGVYDEPQRARCVRVRESAEGKIKQLQSGRT